MTAPTVMGNPMAQWGSRAKGIPGVGVGNPGEGNGIPGAQGAIREVHWDPMVSPWALGSPWVSNNTFDVKLQHLP